MNTKLLMIVLCVAILFSCKNDQSEMLNIVVKGQIENPMGDSIVFERNGQSHKFLVDGSGQFRAEFEGQQGFYIMGYKREFASCYLVPGDSLIVSFNLRRFDETIKFDGSNAAVNNYLAAKSLLSEQQRIKTSVRDLFSMAEDSFINQVNASKKEVIALLSSAELPDDFKALEEKNLEYQAMSELGKYETYHSYFTKQDGFKVSDSFKEKLSGVDYTLEDDFEAVPNYRNLVIEHFTGDELNECLTNLETVKSYAIKNAAVSRLNEWLSPGAENFEECVQKMKAIVNDPQLVKAIDLNYNKMKGLIKGKDSPEFNLKSIDNQMVGLKELKGYNVYVDVWATWCGPCKMEIPHLKELEESYHDAKIKFVSISVDEPADEQKWRDMVADKELKGIQLISENGWNTDFVRKYLITGIPRFILIDSEGKIVSADAPRPSSGEKIRKMLDGLLVEA